jgi:predicted metal-dependent enzyme (double-stranded beta helix superfamily)
MSKDFSRRAFIGSTMAAVGTAAASGASQVAAARTHDAPGDQSSSQGAASDEQQRFITELRSASVNVPAAADSQAAVAEYLRGAVTDSAKRLAFLGTPSAAGIHTLLRSPTLTVLNVVWAPRMVLFPHNHNMWATIAVYDGREDNIIWKPSGEQIAAERAASLATRDVFNLPDDVIHSVVNPIARYTGAIHVYGGDFFAPGRSEWDPQTLRARPWELESAMKNFREASACFEKTRS